VFTIYALDGTVLFSPHGSQELVTIMSEINFEAADTIRLDIDISISNRYTDIDNLPIPEASLPWLKPKIRLHHHIRSLSKYSVSHANVTA